MYNFIVTEILNTIFKCCRSFDPKSFIMLFWGKPCAVVIQVFGAPTWITTDGKGGNIYVWEKIYTTGGTSFPVTTHYNNVRHTTYYTTPLRSHKEIKEFYFTSDDKCYHWRVATE